MEALLMTLLSASPVTDVSFLHEFAETRRYLAGRPVSVQVTPDGSAALFLRSEAKGARQMLFELDLARHETRELLTPEQVLDGATEQLSAAEKARLERQRVSARGFTSYQLSPDGAQLLVGLSGKLYVVERASRKVTRLHTGEGACLDAKFSPDGKTVAYVRANDVYAIELRKNVEHRVSRGGTEVKPNGLAEFVAQEEMSRFAGFWISFDSKQVLYQSSDLSGVEVFGIADPMHPETAPEPFHYPRPGRNNAVVTLWLAPLAGGAATPVHWDATAYPYVTTVKWTAAGPLTLVVMNREQTRLEVLSVDAKSGKTRSLLTETDSAWLNLDQDMPLWWAGGFFWVTERNGAPEVELRNADGSLASSWVAPQAGYRSLAGFDAATRTLFFTGGTNPTESSLFKVVDGGAPLKFETPGRSVGARLTGGGKWLALETTSLEAMPKHHVLGADGRGLVEVPGVALEPPLTLHVELSQLPNDGPWTAVLKPEGFVAGRKYPVILQVYGGPHHQEVVHSMRENLVLQWLANQGFIVVKLDGRGTPRRGRAWERTLRDDFSLTAGDQVAGLQALAKKVPELELSRVGVYGWSFGGYLAALLGLSRGDVVKSAVAGAPVVDWRDYDTFYTERYLGLPEANPKAYESSSLLSYVDQAKRPLLLLHGTADDNVYFLHTLKLSDAMFRAGKAHSVLPLTNFTHMVPDPLVTERLWERIATWFKETL